MLKPNNGFMDEKARIDKFLAIAADAHNSGLLEKPPDNVLSGFSGNRLVGALQRFGRHFAAVSEAVYLEIGVFQGLTLLATAHANPRLTCLGIDDFSLFNESGENKKIVENRMSSLGLENVHILDMDFEDGLTRLQQELPGNDRVGVYFVDGAHDYRSQLISLLLIKPYLRDDAVILVDDANYPHIRQAIHDFLKSEPDFRLLCEAYTPAHPANLSAQADQQAREGWWNGVNILIRDPEGILPRRFPPLTPGARDLHFLTHDLFRHRYAELSFELLHRTDDLLGDQPQGDAVRTELRQMVNRHRQRHPDRFDHRNTYSDALPGFVLNEPGREQ